MKKTALAVVVILSLGSISAKADTQEDKKKVDERLATAADVMREIYAAPDKSIPDDLMNKAHCAVIVPGVKKGAFIVGARYGKGFVTCRKKGGAGWSAPGAIRIEGGSFGFQIGGEETDAIMLVMNARGAEKLLSSKFTLGGEGSVAAGPVGRTAAAQTDAIMHAEILTWSRSRGVFGGVSLSGATLRPDRDDNEAMYGAKLDNKAIVYSKRAAPAAAHPLLEILTTHSRREVH